MEEDFDDATMDACLIAAGQRAEHYEMAAYGTLVAWAQAMGHREAARLLQQTLDEEKAADKKLSGLAEGGINRSAADAAHAEDDEEPVGPPPAPERRRRRPAASRVSAPRGDGAASAAPLPFMRAWRSASCVLACVSAWRPQCSCDGATRHSPSNGARRGRASGGRPGGGNGAPADRRHQRSRVRRFRCPRRAGGIDGRAARASQAAGRRPPACRRSISTTTSDSGGLIFADTVAHCTARSSQAIACRGVSVRPRATTSC